VTHRSSGNKKIKQSAVTKGQQLVDGGKGRDYGNVYKVIIVNGTEMIQVKVHNRSESPRGRRVTERGKLNIVGNDEVGVIRDEGCARWLLCVRICGFGGWQ